MTDNSRAAFFSKVDLRKYGLGGAGLAGILYSMSYFGKGIPEWIVWCILAISILLILTHWIAPLLNLLIKNPVIADDVTHEDNTKYPEKIPMLTLFEKAEEWGKPIINPEKFMDILRQAALDKKITISARTKTKGMSSADVIHMPLNELPYDYWKNHSMELRGYDIINDKVNISNSNNLAMTTRSPNNDRTLHRDLHLNGEAINWLKNNLGVSAILN